MLQTVLAWIFLLRLDSFLELQASLQQLANAPGATEVVVVPLYSAAAVVLLMVTPILAMRSIAEERRNRTMTLLISAPVSMTQIVVGKFCGLTLFLVLQIVLVSMMAMALYIGADLDHGLIAANALGLLFLVATFGSVGIFASSLSAQPLIAAIVALALLLASWLASLANPDPNSLVQLLSVTRRFESFNNGLVDSADVAWHVTVIVLFLALTIRRLDRDRLVGHAV
jgi:ABC-2 type transport system permease protein